jgi:hypothetical protein
MKRSTLAVFFLVVCLLLPILVQAQTGTISGTVTDPAGAVVATAKVTARHTATNATRTAQTGSAGTYTLTNLPVGAYDLTAEAAGFKVVKAANVTLTVGETLTMNLTMQVGTVSQTVEVSASAVAPVELESTQLSNIIDNKQISNLPLVTRDPYALVLLTPGTMQSNTRLGGFSVNGARERNNNFQLDGTDNNDTSVPGIAGGAISINPESTQEFRVITNDFSAEYGRNTGAIIDVVTKSGTNALHGDAYEFGRYNATGARDWFNKEPDKQDPYVRNQFGFSLGGPVIKDKTFFFVNNEFKRYRTARTGYTNVPTSAFKNGIFQYTVTPEMAARANANGDDVAPGTYNVDIANPASPNNVNGMPLDSTMQSLLGLFPAPNGALSQSSPTGQYFFPTSSAENDYNLLAKLDHRISKNNNLALRYAHNRGNDPDPFHDDLIPGLGNTKYDGKSHSINASLTTTLSNTLINEFKAAWNRIDAGFFCQGQSVFNNYSMADAYGRSMDLG